MARFNLQNEILVKTKQGDFKILKEGKLIDLLQDDLIVPQDDIVLPNDKEAALIEPGPAKARFYMAVDDENDIEKIRGKRSEENKNRQLKEFIDESVLSITNRVGVRGRPEQDKQLKSIIFSCLRGVRSLAETREALQRLNLGEGNIDLFLDLIEEDKSKVEVAIKTGKIPEMAKASQSFKHQGEKFTNNKRRFSEEQRGQKQERIKNQSGITPGEARGQKPAIRQTEPIKPPETKFDHVTVGLAGEIEGISLADFRKLGISPNESAEKILEKISLLEDESILKRAEGIQAWHRSEPYGLYLKIGAESIVKHKPVEEIIAQYGQMGSPALTVEEFNEIADLNKKLNY